MATRSTRSEFEQLSALLGGRAPNSLRSLQPAQLKDLAAAIKVARRRESEALAAAGDRALSFIPRLLRGPIRKVVG